MSEEDFEDPSNCQHITLLYREQDPRNWIWCTQCKRLIPVTQIVYNLTLTIDALLHELADLREEVNELKAADPQLAVRKVGSDFKIEPPKGEKPGVLTGNPLGILGLPKVIKGAEHLAKESGKKGPVVLPIRNGGAAGRKDNDSGGELG